MKYRIGDKVKLVKVDDMNELNVKNYINAEAIIIEIDKEYCNPYGLKFDDLKLEKEGNMWWTEAELELTSESLKERAKDNYEAFMLLNNKIEKAANIAGITKEQAYAFMDAFNLE
jgi:hypothetical protein